MSYLIGRLLAALPVMAVVAVVVFLLIHLSPGDPAALIAGDLATGEDIEKLRVALGLGLPIAALTMALTLLVALPLGTLAAHRAGSWIDRLVMLFAVLAFSVPVFLV